MPVLHCQQFAIADNSYSNLIIEFMSVRGGAYYSPALKKWGLYWIWVVRPSVILSVIITFPLNILRTNCQNFTKFYICIHIDKI